MYQFIRRYAILFECGASRPQVIHSAGVWRAAEIVPEASCRRREGPQVPVTDETSDKSACSRHLSLNDKKPRRLAGGWDLYLAEDQNLPIVLSPSK
jgi:hypothetical protein